MQTSTNRQESRVDCTQIAQGARIATDREGNPGCTLAGPGRGDCAHFVGLPGYSIPGQHDGPDTEDHYGKPNGWCWSCWKDHRLEQVQAALRELVDAQDAWNPGGNLHGRTDDQIAKERRLRAAREQALRTAALPPPPSL